ncbi:hypothetical protein OX373_004567 [Salmonella enterica]|nr:hypothetical protein [Salmonella enterica]
MNSLSSRYFYPYGQYGENFTRGSWLPSSVESAFEAQEARDSLNLHNELFKIESITSNPFPFLKRSLNYSSTNLYEDLNNRSVLFSESHSLNESKSGDSYKFSELFSCLISCFSAKGVDG